MELNNQQNKVLSSPLSINNSPISSMSNNSPKMMHQKSPANGQSSKIFRKIFYLVFNFF